jgi:hypothetical protein
MVVGAIRKDKRVKISEFRDHLTRSLPKRKRTLAVGKPGVGKSQAFSDACRELGWEYIPICSPLQSPVKIGGYPRPPSEEGGDATHALFDGIARAFRADKKTLLLFDDLGMAGGETLKAIVDLIQFGRIDGKTLPDCVTVAGATNDVGHGADVQGLIEPLKTRWHTILNVENTLEDFLVYGLAKGFPPDMLAFIRNAPDALHDWKPSKSMAVDGACPRTWEYVADWINDGIDEPEVIGGCVGKGRATQYLAFRRLVNELPDIDSCLMDPKGATVPENPSARLLIAQALAGRITANNFGQVVTYLGRMPRMFQAFAVRDAFKAEAARRRDKTLPDGWKQLASSRNYTAWAVSEEGKDVMSAVS